MLKRGEEVGEGARGGGVRVEGFGEIVRKLVSRPSAGVVLGGEGGDGGVREGGDEGGGEGEGAGG